MIFYYLLLLLMAFYEYVHLPMFFGLTLVKLVGILAVLAAVIYLLNRRQPLFMFRWAESRLFFLLFIIIIASSLVTYAKQNAVPSLMWSYVSHAGCLFATLVFLDSLKRVETSCYVLLASMALAALSVFKDYVRWHVGRPGGITGDPNYYALVALCVLPMCFLLFPGNTLPKKAFLAMTGVLVLVSMLLSSSRGGLIGLMLSLTYVLLRIPRKAGYLILVGLVFAISLAVLPYSGFGRLSSTSYGAEKSIRSRIELLKAGWNMIKSQPLFGVGMGMFKPLSAEYNPDVEAPQIAHNTYLELAAETGLPSLALFVGILWWSWRRVRRQAREFGRSGEVFGERMARSIEVGIVGFSVAAVFLSAAYIRHFWILVFFGLAIERIGLLAAPTEFPATAPAAAASPPGLRPRGRALGRR